MPYESWLVDNPHVPHKFNREHEKAVKKLLTEHGLWEESNAVTKGSYRNVPATKKASNQQGLKGLKNNHYANASYLKKPVDIEHHFSENAVFEPSKPELFYDPVPSYQPKVGDYVRMIIPERCKQEHRLYDRLGGIIIRILKKEAWVRLCIGCKKVVLQVPCSWEWLSPQIEPKAPDRVRIVKEIRQSYRKKFNPAQLSLHALPVNTEDAQDDYDLANEKAHDFSRGMKVSHIYR